MEIMHKGMWTGRRVLYLSVDAIRANPDQPRKYFEPEALRELAEMYRDERGGLSSLLLLIADNVTRCAGKLECEEKPMEETV